jgi:hypothetical protein
MENVSLNATVDLFQEIDKFSTLTTFMFIVPECINIIVLVIVLYGMYQGIEIKHPLYSILFANMIITLASSVTDIIAFGFISANKYVQLTNLMSSTSILYHCASWCLTSILRYIYIFHEDLIPNLFPNQNLQSFLGVTALLLFSTLLAVPILSVAFSLGKYFFK